MKLASVNLKAITLECGGKSPLIVCADADIDKAVKAGHSGIMFNAGQVCTATSPIFVHESVYDRYVAGFKDRIKEASKVGHPFEKTTSQGPQVSKTQRERVLGFIEQGKKAGAKVAAGGNPTGERG